jgi:hypothetical protein
METTKQAAEGKIRELIEDAFSGARVFQGGGNEIIGTDLQQMMSEAAENALQRLYPQFNTADHAGWGKVYEKAQKGAPDALKAVGDEGESSKNSVCKAILGAIAGGKKGVDIRTLFEASPYGWSRDAIEGGLQVLLVAGLVRAQDERGQTVDPKELERKNIGKTIFKAESATVTTTQRIQIRKLMQQVGINAKQGEELSFAPPFLQKMFDLADRAGGDAPKPAHPDTAFLNDIRLTAGNEQLIALYNQRDKLGDCFTEWTSLAERIAQRWPNWGVATRLVRHAAGLSSCEIFIAQAKTIETQRQLLEEPDPVAPLIASLTQALREELNRLDGEYATRHQQGRNQLAEDPNWKQLEPEQRYQLMSGQNLHENARPKVAVQSTNDVLATLDICPLDKLDAIVAAIPSRFDSVAAEAVELCVPKVQFVQVSRRVLKTDDEIDAWLDEVKKRFKAALQKGPVMIK